MLYRGEFVLCAPWNKGLFVCFFFLSFQEIKVVKSIVLIFCDSSINRMGENPKKGFRVLLKHQLSLAQVSPEPSAHCLCKESASSSMCNRTRSAHIQPHVVCK